MTPEPAFERLEQEQEKLRAENPTMPAKLVALITTFQRWLYMPDPTPLLAVLGTVAANRISGDPLWLLLIGPPGGGKTELLQPLRGLAGVHVTSTMTEASLLSGTPSREKSHGASGGLLRTIGQRGILLCKDFTSVLSMNRDARAALLAALREIYDGSWTRHIGSDGGRTLHWDGKLGMVAACTSVIDNHHAVIASMGERFIMFRLPVADDNKLALRALEHQDNGSEMRHELEGAVQDLFAGEQLPACKLDDPERKRLVALATLAAHCRSPVERDGYTREVQLIPDTEAPGRIALALAQLLNGLSAIGATRADAWRVVSKVAMDCLPSLRFKAFQILGGAENFVNTTTVATAICYPKQTTRRAIEDLEAHRVVQRAPGGEGKADNWRLSDWAREKCSEAEMTFPETLEPDEGEAFPEMLGEDGK